MDRRFVWFVRFVVHMLLGCAERIGNIHIKKGHHQGSPDDSLSPMRAEGVIPAAVLNRTWLLIGDTENVVKLWQIDDRVGYLNTFHHLGSCWVWLSPLQRALIVPYIGPEIVGAHRPHFHLPSY